MRRFGELEAVIMDRLWEWGRPVLVREVVDDLRDERGLAYTTVMTVMENLYRKGWLRRERDGRALRDEPAGSRSGYTAALMNHAPGPPPAHPLPPSPRHRCPSLPLLPRLRSVARGFRAPDPVQALTRPPPQPRHP